MSINTVHIHTDFKFTHNTKMFVGTYFTNTSIVINQNKAIPKTDEEMLLFNTDDADFQKIVDICTQADLVVLYDLNSIKIKLALALPKEVKIAWRFFGYELYGKRPDLFKSELSRKYDVLPLKNRLKRRMSPYYQRIVNGQSYSENFEKAVKRIDYFLALSPEEYGFLKMYWPSLPKFFKLPHFHFDRKLIELDFDKKEMERPLIIVGNNRSSYNNHLDVIELIEKYENKQNFDFTLFFNYGIKGKYTDEVIKRTEQKSHYSVINDFLNQHDFLAMYQKATALVINGYRQMAGANIRTALEHGVKVYLNNKNVHKQFLENQGFKIFSIEDFESDFQNNTLGLDEESATHNMKNFKHFAESYTQADFQKALLHEMTGNR